MEGKKSGQSEEIVLLEALRQETESPRTSSHGRSFQAFEGSLSR